MSDASDILKDDASLAALNRTVLCFSKTIYRTNGVWEGANPLVPILPMFIFQLTVAITVTRVVLFIVRFLNQPPLVGEILSGILLGPSAIGKIAKFRTSVFPSYSFLVVEPMAHFALIYYAFLVGLEMDISSIPRTGTKALRVAVSGTIVPFIIGSTICAYITTDGSLGWLFGGISLTVTGFSMLAQLLEKHSLIHTELGKTALYSAQLSELISWVLLALALAVSNKGVDGVFWSLTVTTAAILSCVYGVRKALLWIIRRTPEGQGYSEYYVCSILTGVALVGVVMDIGGTHPMIGAFVFGLIIPNTVLEATLLDRLEDFVHGIFMPIFFAVCGLRTNIDVMTANQSWMMVLIVIMFACLAKVLATICVSGLNNMKINETLAIGVLTNAKSTMAMIVLEIGQEQKALNTQAYSILVFAILIMTMAVTPITAIQHSGAKDVEPYKRKTIQKSKSDEEFRILACVHGIRNVGAMINLLDATNSSPESPMSVFVAHLVELVGRTTATLIVHSARKAGPRNPSHSEAQTEQIISAFDNYELRHDGVTIQALTAKSAYTSMDEDICMIARDYRTAFIILPFHKIQSLDGEMEDINPAIQSVNENVLVNAPCSVGILIDKGLAESGQPARRIAMLFFGGPDDREGLAYAWRMSEHKLARLTVLRFVPSTDAMPMEGLDLEDDRGDVMVNVDKEKEEALDNEFIMKFKSATSVNESVTYTEMVLNDEEETIRAIKSTDGQHDLYIVGKGRGVVCPLTAELTDWCDCPELGAIGDLLVTSEFNSMFAVIVVQQYAKPMESKEGSVRSSTSFQDAASAEWRQSQRRE